MFPDLSGMPTNYLRKRTVGATIFYDLYVAIPLPRNWKMANAPSISANSNVLSVSFRTLYDPTAGDSIYTCALEGILIGGGNITTIQVDNTPPNHSKPLFSNAIELIWADNNNETYNGIPTDCPFLFVETLSESAVTTTVVPHVMNNRAAIDYGPTGAGLLSQQVLGGKFFEIPCLQLAGNGWAVAPDLPTILTLGAAEAVEVQFFIGGGPGKKNKTKPILTSGGGETMPSQSSSSEANTSALVKQLAQDNSGAIIIVINQ